MTTYVRPFELRDLKHVDVEFFSYRTARVGEVFLVLPRDLVEKLEEALAEKAGVHIDNHTAYAVTYFKGRQDEESIFIRFSDQSVSFGRRIEKDSY